MSRMGIESTSARLTLHSHWNLLSSAAIAVPSTPVLTVSTPGLMTLPLVEGSLTTRIISDSTEDNVELGSMRSMDLGLFRTRCGEGEGKMSAMTILVQLTKLYRCYWRWTMAM